ncbi:hypothetical protein CA13_72250 [Planctomycetes bacterium CA13]|uniref:Uncharacterized protein n=1 Tax=Novipirellula herctigrandis TaxID=2527986 RepID=A0A5C5YPF7_9BACT|nr:hypothetical protein CA13_72250 [Planctomycetes bacterium CA13]
MQNAVFTLLSLAIATVSFGADWLTLPSTYTHDPMTFQRVAQYQPIAAPTTLAVSDFQTSGYTHMRSTLAYGQSADNYHRVESWGPPVRPYGEWRFPYRPYSTPYPNWGAPYAGLNLGPNFYGGAGGSVGYPKHGKPSRNHPESGHDYPGSGHNYPGSGHDYPGSGQGPISGDHDWPSERRRGNNTPVDAGSLNPYPFGAGTAYPSAPYYDGYYPNYAD